MKTRLGQVESATSAKSKVGQAPTKRYASFVVRGWLPGATGTLQIAHDQSGERVQADSLVEAIGWIQSHSVLTAAPADDVLGENRESIEARSRDYSKASAA